MEPSSATQALESTGRTGSDDQSPLGTIDWESYTPTRSFVRRGRRVQSSTRAPGCWQRLFARRRGAAWRASLGRGEEGRESCAPPLTTRGGAAGGERRSASPSAAALRALAPRPRGPAVAALTGGRSCGRPRHVGRRRRSTRWSDNVVASRTARAARVHGHDGWRSGFVRGRRFRCSGGDGLPKLSFLAGVVIFAGILSSKASRDGGVLGGSGGGLSPRAGREASSRSASNGVDVSCL